MRTRDTTTDLLPVSSTDSSPDVTAAHIVTIVALSDDGTPSVDLGPADPAVPARLAMRASRERIETAIAERQQAVVVFEHGDRTRPIIVGLIEPLAPTDAALVEADVDGRRVRLTAEDEIVLQCGSASITLRRNGRVVIRGAYVESHSQGTNRIKGGQVQIN
jgi:hypothetical protein